MNLASRKILDYFYEEDKVTRKNGTNNKKTEVGEFATSSLEHLSFGFDYLIAKRIINRDSIFCDMGCGDGRVNALVSGAYRIQSLGIEYDDEIVARAKYHIFKLRHVINGTQVNIAKGDFMNDEVYDSEGIPFKTIMTFFNYVNSQRSIANKIAEQSPKGTVFILYDGRPKPEGFKGLKLELSLELVDNANEVIVRFPSSSDKPIALQPLPDRAYMHVYRK